MFKVVIGKASFGGSLGLQDKIVATAAGDLESKLNDGLVEKVLAVSVYESEKELQLISIVDSKAEEKSASKKGGK